MRMKLLLTLFAMFGTFCWGVAVGVYHWPPFDSLLALKGWLVRPQIVQPSSTEPPEFDIAAFEDLDVGELISLRQMSEVEPLRSEVIRYIWKTDELPLGVRPAAITERDTVGAINVPTGVTVKELTISLAHDFVSRPSYFQQSGTERSTLLIYHQGHQGGFEEIGRASIEFFLSMGLDVLALDVPFRGSHTGPKEVQHPTFGPIALWGDHRTLELLETEEFSPISLFTTPILASLNYLLDEQGYQEIVMVGLSGGGWVTSLYAAVDPRVKQSYPVAGGVPLFLRSRVVQGLYSRGDYEQTHLPLYRIANHLELYVLGAVGEGRKQIQVLNANDPCCFRGPLGAIFAPSVRSRVAELGSGIFDLVIDDSHENHAISPWALDFIRREMILGSPSLSLSFE